MDKKHCEKTRRAWPDSQRAEEMENLWEEVDKAQEARSQGQGDGRQEWRGGRTGKLCRGAVGPTCLPHPPCSPPLADWPARHLLGNYRGAHSWEAWQRLGRFPKGTFAFRNEN